MSNYLDNLVMRNQQAIDVVRPRLPSIFEPPAAMPFVSSMPHGVAPPGRIPSPDDLSGPRAEHQSAVMPAQGEREPLNGFPNRDGERGIERAERRERLIKSETQARVPEPSAPARTIPAWRGVQVIDEAADLPDTPAPGAQRSADLSPRLSTVSNVTEPTRRSLSDEIQEKPSDDHRPERERWHENQLPSPALTPHQTSKAALLADRSEGPIVVEPRVSPLRQTARENGSDDTAGNRSRREQLVQPLAEPPMPTINVTIGRIEVKAMPPAAASPPARKPTPSLMSLDEYMRRRNAGDDSR